MAAGLMEKSRQGCAFDLGIAWREPRVVQSGKTIEHAAIGPGEIMDKERGVIAAFSGANFDNHDVIQC